MTLAKVMKQDGMLLAKVKEQDGMVLAKVKEQDGMMLAKVKEQDGIYSACKSKSPKYPYTQRIKCCHDLQQMRNPRFLYLGLLQPSIASLDMSSSSIQAADVVILGTFTFTSTIYSILFLYFCKHHPILFLYFCKNHPILFLYFCKQHPILFHYFCKSHPYNFYFFC